jgi:phosphotransferase system enzyme I (PtsI)
MQEFRLQGFSISEGIALGPLLFLPSLLEESILEFSVAKTHLECEIARYYKAVEQSREDIRFLQFKLKKEDSQEALEILETHVQMLEDPLMTSHVEEKIRFTQKNAESVFSSVIREYEQKFSRIKDPFFQQRIVDVLDVSKRVLDHLSGKGRLNFSEIPEDSIIFTRELSPSYVAALQATAQVGAFITQYGGISSHAALMARAKGIPYVSNIDVNCVLEKIRSQDHCSVVVDGKTGIVVFYPIPSTLKSYQKIRIRVKNTCRSLEKDLYPETETQDGYPVHVYANVGNLLDLEEMHLHCPAGIGLFRSEYLFLEKNTLFLSEEEQMRSYVEIAKKAEGLSIVVRVFDVGGDKNPQAFPDQEKESNPVLGCRGIRFLLRHQDLFRIQLRAMMKAFDLVDMKILLPLISDPQEVIEAKKIIISIQNELEEQGLISKKYFPIGCMIEVPSAAFLCDAIAKEVDFFSIGTNDLVQYTLGMDRSNPATQDFFHPTHPSVIRMIKMIVMEAKRQNKPVTICGEMASSPLLIPLLLGLGLSEFSCSPRDIPLIKKAIRRCNLFDCYQLAQKILQMGSHGEIAKTLQAVYET